MQHNYSALLQFSYWVNSLALDTALCRGQTNSHFQSC